MLMMLLDVGRSCCLLLMLLCAPMAYGVGTVTDCYNECSQSNISCSLKRISCHFPIRFAEIQEAWPGGPRNLTGKIVFLEEQKTYQAKFSWQPPFDSSINALKGFLLTVQTYDNEDGVFGIPFCYLLNVTQANWTRQSIAYNAAFSFNCLSFRMRTKVKFEVTSLPKPERNAEHQIITVITPGVRTVQWLPRITTQVSYDDDDAIMVKVSFMPLFQGAHSHLVCLEKNTHCVDYTNVEAPADYVVFHNVPPNTNYSIWLRPSDKDGRFLTREYRQSQPFSALVKPTNAPRTMASPAIDSMTIISIAVLMPVIFIIALVTTLVYCCHKGNLKCFTNADMKDANSRKSNSSAEKIVETKIAPIYSYDDSWYDKSMKSLFNYLNITTDTDIILSLDSPSDMLKALKSWKQGNSCYVLMMVVSDDILQILQMKNAQQDVAALTQPSVPICLEMLNLLHSIDQGEAIGGQVIITSLFTSTQTQFKNFFPGVENIHCVADCKENEVGCQLRQEKVKGLVQDMLHSVGLTNKYNSISKNLTVKSPNAVALTQDLNKLLKSCAQLREIKTHRNSLALNPSQFVPHRCMYNVPLMSHAPLATSTIIGDGSHMALPHMHGNLRNAMGDDHDDNFTLASLMSGHYQSSLDKDRVDMPDACDSGFRSYNTQIHSLDEEIISEEQAPFLGHHVKREDFVPPDTDDEDVGDNVSFSNGVMEFNQKVHWHK